MAVQQDLERAESAVAAPVVCDRGGRLPALRRTDAGAVAPAMRARQLPLPLLLPLPWRASRAVGGRCRRQLVDVVELADYGSEMMPRTIWQSLHDRRDPNRNNV